MLWIIRRERKKDYLAVREMFPALIGNRRFEKNEDSHSNMPDGNMR